ncbi:hypothetical protein ABEV00_00510 [Paenibacillus thiaminolyticus]|uniref:hypothetical protein n=1 Tax=Paenibacillus TaxID=44249 RepID=UPI001059B369|nr:hypothetical protein [Paenibacillus dendritiformis]TDL51608.1 hypothetical protein E2R60_18415 [Paenibacillus dendritiformis]
MEHVDEQIISLLYGESEEQEARGKKENKMTPPQFASPQTILKINGETVPFTEEQLLDGKLRVPLPKTFHVMSPETAALKYPSEQRPDVIYSNDTASINIAFNHTEQSLSANEVEEFTAAMVQILRRTQPILQWYEDGVRYIREKPIGYCEFQIPSLSANLYQLMFFAELDGRALLCTFNCTEEEIKHWKPIAWGMMDSLDFGKEGHNDEPVGARLS